MPAFSHLDPGTPEDVWAADGRITSAPAFDDAIDHLIVVAAHPDDETLGAAGLMQRVHAHGGRVSVVVASDGEASHPDSPGMAPERLAGLRRVEVSEAVHLAAPGAALHFLGLPDGGLEEHRGPLLEAVTALLPAADAGRVVIAAPFSGDGHRDHRIAAEVSRDAAARIGASHVGYPIWLWHWGTPADVPWEVAATLTLGPDERAVKAEALARHATQVLPLSPAPGDEPVVHARMLAHFQRDVEVFLREAAPDSDRTMPAGWFEDFYSRHRDPWGFETRWYERRKRAVLAACLPVERLGRVLEVGCATGLITRDLAPRADSIVAVDASERALDLARERLAGTPDVTFVRAAIPADWPAGTFDTIVFSEIGYYLSRHDLDEALERMDGALSEDGRIVACHWRHPVPEYPLGGDDVHRAFRRRTGWTATVRHEEADFVLEVFERTPARSVAAREGLS